MTHLLTILLPIMLQLGSTEDTLTYYYPDNTIGAIPQLYYKSSETAPDSILLVGHTEFVDCQMQQRWVPIESGTELSTGGVITLCYAEQEGSYELHPAPTEPEGIAHTEDTHTPRKILRDGQLFILREGIVYTINGTRK